jgi:putative nucleotidyltransferase with HDIG domain
MTREDKLKFFANEFAYIKNENFRKFAEEVIANADDWFFVEPASLSGRYHPTFSLGEGGLVRHTRCVAYFAMSMAESMNFNQEDSDLIIIAALAHDIKKHDNNKNYMREHPLLASEYLCGIMEKFTEDEITNEQVQKICCAVASHMGKWEAKEPWLKGREPFPMPSNDFEKALQAADYIASRKKILEFDFDTVETVSLPKLNEQKTKNVEDYTLEELEVYVLPFGKHKGKTFKEAKTDGYLDWMVSQTNFNCKDVQVLAKRYLGLLSGEIIQNKGDENFPVTVGSVDDLPF